jgi:subfamily B ATP-binding cassette protein MsbA
LLGYTKPYIWGFVVTFFALLLAGLTEAAFPALIKPLIDKGFVGTSEFQVWMVPLAILGIFLFRGVGTLIAAYSMNWVSNNVLRDLRRDMFSAMLSLPSKFFDQTPAGVVISRVTTEVNGTLAGVSSVLISLVRDSVVFCALMGWLFWVNWRLTLVVVFVFPPIVLVLKIIGRRMARIGSEQITANSDLTQVLEEAITANRLIKLFGGGALEQQKFSSASERFRQYSMKVSLAHAAQAPIVQLFVALAIAIIVSMALVQTRSGDTTVGSFVSFITAMLMLLSPIRHLSEVNAQIQRAMVSAKVAFEFLDQEKELDSGRLSAGGVRGFFEFIDVTLSYQQDRAAALKGISLTIRPGSTVAFVGPSGGGKSSIVNLMTRLYEPSGGSVLLDGQPIQNYTLSSLRNSIAVVSQDPVLFNDSIRNNVAYGDDRSEDGRIIRALNDAGLEEFFSSLPNGLDTQLGDRGAMLSGGQRQRIAIARAFFKNAPILILDEPTSALDQISERALQDVIQRLSKDRTVIFITHRIATIENVDCIYYIEGGLIQHFGNHSDLLKLSPGYRRLQAAGQ